MPKKHRSAKKQSTNPDLLAQLAGVLWLPEGLDGAERGTRIASAEARLHELRSAAGIESMLACQMVAAHEAAMECLGRSTAADQPEAGRDQNLKHAERLMALFARQVEVLGRHRLREQKLKDQRRKEAKKAERRITKIQTTIVSPDGEEYPEDEYFRIEAAAEAARAADSGAAQPGAQPGAAGGTKGGTKGDRVTGDAATDGEAASDRAAGRRSYLNPGGI